MWVQLEVRSKSAFFYTISGVGLTWASGFAAGLGEIRREGGWQRTCPTVGLGGLWRLNLKGPGVHTGPTGKLRPAAAPSTVTGRL